MTKTFGAKSTADEVLAGVDLKGKRFLITGVSSGIAPSRRSMTRPTRLPMASGPMRSMPTKPSSSGRKVRH
ncbi:hypothetical protein CHY08_13860 [Rhizobium leguminosarum bv. viciae]|nr:hypothetical protein CHY08_13860 [Rhizobium leguminosarum bv. viciae]